MGILIPGEFVIICPSTRARSRVKRYAEVAELVDAHDSGSCARKGVEVRVFSSAPPSNEGGCDIPLLAFVSCKVRMSISQLAAIEQGKSF